MPKQADAITAFRLTRDEALLIRSGLNWIISVHHLWKDSGESWDPAWSDMSLPVPTDPGEYSAQHQAMVFQVALTATRPFQARSRRLRMDPLSLRPAPSDCVLWKCCTATGTSGCSF